MPTDYEFSVDWFSPHWPNWQAVTRNLSIQKILEIGSFEGRSTCKMIEEFGSKSDISIYCIDTWGGGVEHLKFDMNSIEARFDRNIDHARNLASHSVHIEKCKGLSGDQMCRLLVADHRETFDLVFVDGSHQAPDVMTDLALAYQLCRIGGLLICDDYLWSMEPDGKQDILNMPKIAVDAFSTIFARKIKQISMPLYQTYFRKIA